MPPLSPPCPAPILIVDDSSSARSALARMVSMVDGTCVIEVPDGTAAIEAVKAQDFAAILMDVEMPDMDGYQAARAIKATDQGQHIPILFITGLALDPAKMDEVYTQGAADILLKPVRPPVLMAKIKNFAAAYWHQKNLVAVNEKLRAVSENSASASQAKSVFLANMSHEIRTPLNGILGTVELLRQTTLDQTQTRYTDIISSSGEALLGILNDILDLSKIEAGRVEVQPETIGMDAFLKGVTEPHVPRAALNRIELLCRVHAGVPDTITVDPVLLRQILFNFLSNAVKFTSSGYVVLDVSVKDAGVLRFTVKDTGLGIPADRLNEVFDMFTQVDPTTTRKFGGTGLGLAITRNLVHVLKGKIGVESAAGQGSTFWVDIPVVFGNPPKGAFQRPVLWVTLDDMTARVVAENLADMGMADVSFLDAPTPHRIQALVNTPTLVLIRQSMLMGGDPGLVDEWYHLFHDRLVVVQGVSENQEQLPNPRLKILYALHGRQDLRDVLGGQSDNTAAIAMDKKSDALLQKHSGHVLLVEDDPVNRMIASESLERLGYRVSVAENGLRALDKVAEAKFDVILMDCMMPAMDGYQATERIRAGDSPNKTTRIIALTASVMESDRKKALDSGMDDFLSKPFRRQDLAEKLVAGAARQT
jgi:two-component system sensor histidine kinase/response regulator